MRKQSYKFTLIALGTILVLFLAAMILSYSLSRGDPTSTDIGMMWFAAGSFVATAGSVIALVWTLYEQRKMTQNAARAVLQVMDIRIHPSSPGYFWLFFKLRNHGQTAAFGVYAKGTLRFSPGASDVGGRLGNEVSEDFVGREIAQIPPKSDGETRYLSSDAEAFLRLPERAGRYPYDGTADSAPDELFVKGVVIFFDVFEQRHELPFEMKMLEMSGETSFVGMDAYYRG